MDRDRPDSPDPLADQLMTMRIVAGSLLLGVVFFVLIALFVLGAWQAPPKGHLLSLLGVALAAVAAVVSFVFPPASALEQAMQAPAGRQKVANAAGIFQTRTIIRLALLEGAAFFNAVALMVEHNRWSLGVVAALLIVMAFHFPTRTRLQHFVETREFEQSQLP